MKRIGLLSLLPLALVGLALTGCLGYKLGGSSLPDGIETVCVAPVVNRTAEPAIELEVTRAVRQRIQFDGRLKLVNTPDEADAVLRVALTDYRLTPIDYRNADREEYNNTANRYRLRITARSTLENRETGKPLARSKTYGESTFSFRSDLTTSKRNALPRAADELAQYLVDDLVEGWQ